MSGYLPIGLLSVLATGVTAVLVARRFAAPTAKLLAGVCVCLVTVAVSQVVVLTPSPLREALTATTGVGLPGDYWVAIALGLTFPAGGLWLLFSIQYTGRGSRLRRQVGALTVAVIGSFYAGAVYVVFQTDGGQSVATLVAGVFASGLFFVSPLASLGTVLVIEAALRRNAVPLQEGVTLAAGGVLFVYAPIVAFNLDMPVAVPTFLIGASFAFGIAVERYPVFETLPRARIAARDRLFNETDDAIVLVDDQTRVVELNPAAESLFGIDSADTLQRSLHEVFPAAPPPAELAAADTPSVFRLGGRRIEVTTSRVVGEYGASVGHLFVCRDVTDRQRRDRRLRVLTRFLAETVGQRAVGVVDQVDRLTDSERGASGVRDDAPSTAVAEDIRQTTALLDRLAATTRRLDRALSTRGSGPSDVETLARDFAAERAQVTLTVEGAGSETTAAVDSEVLLAVLDLLLEDLLTRGVSSLQLTVRPSRDPGPVIELREEPSPSGDGRETGQDAVGPSDDRGGTMSQSASRTEPAIVLSRLALEHAGGTVEQRDERSLRIQLRTDSPGATSSLVSDDGRGDGTSGTQARTRPEKKEEEPQ